MSAGATRSSKKKQSLQTFTYFIPAPPHRKTGYREKEFDKIMTGILQSGFELADLRTESVDGGVFVMAFLKPMDKRALKLDQDLDMQDLFKLKDNHTSVEIILEDEDA